MDTEGLQTARLIPTSGINGADEAERRATSALLAVMSIVKEFGSAMLKPLGAPSGQVDAFVEVPFRLAEDRVVQPDGLVQVTRGKTSWTTLVEVKTGSGQLRREQVEDYLDAARSQRIGTVLTISNELAPAHGVHPVEVDKRKLRSVNLAHLSWAEILTLAIQTRVHRGVSDPEQAWILGELIRYLEHPRSGALDFSDMGGSWTTIRDSVAAGTLRKGDKGLAEVASRWDQLLRFAALRLGRELGADVQVATSRKELADPSQRIARFAGELVAVGSLTGALRIPGAIGSLEVCADLRSSKVTTLVDIEAPQTGRLPTKVSWLTRQLKDAPAQLRIDGLISGTSATTSDTLGRVREDPSLLIDTQKRDFRGFRIAATSPLGVKRGVGRGAFIDSVLAALDGFYGEVVQDLRPWATRAPQLPPSGRLAVEEAGIDTAPPRSDMLAPEVTALQTAPTDDARAGELLPDVALPAGDETPTPEVRSDLVSWDAATDRLDRERLNDWAFSQPDDDAHDPASDQREENGDSPDDPPTANA